MPFQEVNCSVTLQYSDNVAHDITSPPSFSYTLYFIYACKCI